MKFTNLFNLPDPLFRALTMDDYELRGDISVTGLIKPPRMTQLEKRHADQIKEDAAERVWLLLGKSVHVVLERAAGRKTITEHQVETEVAGWTVSGTLDMWDNEVLNDYKVSSVWSVIYGLKPEWEVQTNIYRYMLDMPVKSMQIVVIIRDHQKSKAKNDPDYPQVPIGILPVPMWETDDVMSWMYVRVRQHQINSELPDDQLDLCTPEERWEKPTTYAVKAKGRKTAFRVLDSMEEAEEWMEKNGKGTFIETRTGKSTRCEDYCPVKNFCNQYREMEA